jgi:hypothetical protein
MPGQGRPEASRLLAGLLGTISRNSPAWSEKPALRGTADGVRNSIWYSGVAPLARLLTTGEFAGADQLHRGPDAADG